MNTDSALFLTFDLDWASDEVFRDTLNILLAENVSATFFITHATPLLEEIRQNPLFELGIHPNFNGMPNNAFSAKPYAQIVDELMAIVPEAKCVRSHALAQSTLLIDVFASRGLTHDLNLLLPMRSGIALKPFRHWNGMIRAPYLWEDDVHCLDLRAGRVSGWDPAPFLDCPGLKIFDFHPIHIFLNTEDLERYERARPHFRDIDALSVLRNNDTPPPTQGGTRGFLIELIREAKARGLTFMKAGDIAL